MSFRLYANVVGTGLANAATKIIYINTDEDYDAEIDVEFNLDGDCSYDIAKATVAPTSPTGSITLHTEIKQKVATSAAKTKFYGGVTGGSYTDVMNKKYLTGGKTFVKGQPQLQKIVLEKNSWYRITLTNDSGGAIDYENTYNINEQPNNDALDSLF